MQFMIHLSKALVMLSYGITRHFRKFFWSSFLVPGVYSKALAWYVKQDAVNLD